MSNEPALTLYNDGYAISTDKRHLDTGLIHDFLSRQSYWAQDMTQELVEASIANSTLCYGLYEGNPEAGPARQIGFARVVSDMVRFSWLADVFVLPDYRGQGLGKRLIGAITSHPRLRGTDFQLGTRDAHGLYRQFGFEPMARMERRMNRPLNWDLIYESYGLTKG